jgi:hypothetical protein
MEQEGAAPSPVVPSGEPVSNTHAEDPLSEGLGALVPLVLDPLLQGMTLACAKMPILDASMFQVNVLQGMLDSGCFTGVLSKPASGAFSTTKDMAMHAHAAGLRALLEEAVEVLVQEQYLSIIRQAGISRLMECLCQAPAMAKLEADADGNTAQKFVPLSTISGLDGSAVTAILQALDAFLCTVSVDISVSLERILDTRIARHVAREGFRRFLDAYRQLHAAIMDPGHGYGTVQQRLLRSVEQVSLLILMEEGEEDAVPLPDAAVNVA